MEGCRAAYQLNWSLSVFRRQVAPPAGQWLDALRESTERDGVRILEHRFGERRGYRIIHAGQVEHHTMADCCIQERLGRFQFHEERTDLSNVRNSAHGQFHHTLHVVMVYRDRGKFRPVV